MKHFPAIHWVGFARDTGDPTQRANMKAHLDQGCIECMAQVSTWTSLAKFAEQEPSYEPPANALRIAKSYLHPFMQSFKENANIRVLKHTFDSFGIGAAIGVRGLTAVPRQLLYTSSSLFIDLRMEQKPRSAWMVLTGQLVDELLTEGIPSGSQVYLLSKREPALHAITNACGEFSFRFKPKGGLALLLSLNDEAFLLQLPESPDV